MNIFKKLYQLVNNSLRKVIGRNENFYFIPSIKFYYEKEGGSFYKGRYLNNGFHGYHLSIKFLKQDLFLGKKKKFKTK